MSVSSYTDTLQLGLINFNSPNWHDDAWRNLRIIDAAIAAELDAFPFAVATGTNALVVNYDPPITAYTVGLAIMFKLTNSPTGPVTVDVNGLGPKAVLIQGQPVQANDLLADDIVRVVYDGTQFNALNAARVLPALRVREGDSGATAHTDADAIIAEGDTATGISLLTNDVGLASILFGRPSDNDAGGITYNHASDSFAIFTPTSSAIFGDKVLLQCDGKEYILLLDKDYQFNVPSAGVTRFGPVDTPGRGLFFVDANGRVGINQAMPDTALHVNGVVKAASFEGTVNVGTVTGTLAIGNGGTGATNAPAARTNLGLGTIALLNAINNTHWSGPALSIANGGTGATTPADARTALGALAAANPVYTGNATKSGKGGVVYADNPALTDVKIRVEAFGAPAPALGEILFEY